ncbi:MAG: hypothetical protein P1V97_35425, partial [Planctomycetota bacterium]|nr:hypothetical protein [Planctomycetota bacterium]
NLLSDPSEVVRERISEVALDFEFDDGLPEFIKTQLRDGALSNVAGVQSTHLALLRDQRFEDETLAPTLKKVIESNKTSGADLEGALFAAAHMPKLRDQLVDRAIALAGVEDEEVYGKALILLLSSKGPEKSLSLLAKSDVELRVRLFATMSAWGETSIAEDKGGEVFASLFSALSHKEDKIKEVALRTFCEMDLDDDQKERVFLAAKSLKESKGEIGELALNTMLTLLPLKLPEKLVANALKSDNTDLAYAIINTLSSVEEPTQQKLAARLLLASMASDDEDLGDSAMEALAQMGEASHSALETILASGTANRRLQALNALSTQGTKARKLAPLVAKLVKSNRPALAKAAVRTLGFMKATQFNTQLRDLVEIAAPSLKGECWIALARLGAKDSGAEIERLLNNGSVAQNSEYLVRNLVRIDRTRGLRYLMGSLRARYGQIPATRAAVMLGNLKAGAKVVLPDLKALKDDPNKNIQKAVIAAVDKIEKSLPK